jgi:hypothetical protein
MTELLDVVVEAHGGLDRWNQLNNIKAKLTVAGAIWEFKQKPGLLTDVTFESNIHDQPQVVYRDFAGKGNQSVFRPDKLFVRNEKGEVLWTRDNPRNAFDATSPWNELNVAYFSSSRDVELPYSAVHLYPSGFCDRRSRAADRKR